MFPLQHTHVMLLDISLLTDNLNEWMARSMVAYETNRNMGA
jgi:hypothetical protein